MHIAAHALMMSVVTSRDPHLIVVCLHLLCALHDVSVYLPTSLHLLSREVGTLIHLAQILSQMDVHYVMAHDTTCHLPLRNVSFEAS